MKIILPFLLVLSFTSPVLACWDDPYWDFRANASRKDLEDFFSYIKENYAFDIVEDDVSNTYAAKSTYYKAVSTKQDVCHGNFTVQFIDGYIGVGAIVGLPDGSINTCSDKIKEIVLSYLKSRNLLPDPDPDSDSGC